MRGLFLLLPFAFAMHGGGSRRRPAPARPAAAAPATRMVASDHLREISEHVSGSQSITYLIAMAAALAVPLVGATEAQRQRRQDLIYATGVQFGRLLTETTPPQLDPPVIERPNVSEVARLDNRLDTSPRDAAATRWRDVEAVAGLLNFRSEADLSADQRAALEELARGEGYASLSDLQGQTATLPRFCFSWMRSLIMRAVNGTQINVTCEKGASCKFRSTHRHSLMDFSRMEYLAYATAILRNVFKPKEVQTPAPQEPASQDGWGDDDPAPELKLNPKWLRTLKTDRPGGARMSGGYSINDHLAYHKDRAMAAVQEKERLRQLNLLRSWCRDFLPRD